MAHICNDSTLGGGGGWNTCGQEFETSLANMILRRLRQENPLNPEGGGCSELRSRHCTPAWTTERDSVPKKKVKMPELGKEQSAAHSSFKRTSVCSIPFCTPKGFSPKPQDKETHSSSSRFTQRSAHHAQPQYNKLSICLIFYPHSNPRSWYEDEPPLNSRQARKETDTESWDDRPSLAVNTMQPSLNSETQVLAAEGRESLALLPRLESSGAILAHYNLCPLGSSDPSSSASQVAGITSMSHFIYMGFHHVGDQAGLELLTSRDPPALSSQSVGITGLSSRTCPYHTCLRTEVHIGARSKAKPLSVSGVAKLVAAVYTCNPSTVGGRGGQIALSSGVREFESSLGNMARPCLYKKYKNCPDVVACAYRPSY
ncbi:hypothetical protein AAY473_014335 [Plecturocebus cupreus]